MRSPFVDEWRGRGDAAREEAPRLREELRALIDEHRLDSAMAFGGQTAGMIKDVAPAASIVREMVAQAEQALRDGALLANSTP